MQQSSELIIIVMHVLQMRELRVRGAHHVTVR